MGRRIQYARTTLAIQARDRASIDVLVAGSMSPLETGYRPSLWRVWVDQFREFTRQDVTPR